MERVSTLPERLTVTPAISIVIPAHNEEGTIGRTLGALRTGSHPGEFEIIVICNGCTDETAAVAARSGTDITVIEVPEPSKQQALRRGDEAAHVFPRIYIDADVEISGDSVRALADTLRVSGADAAGPRRTFFRFGVSWGVRWFYDVWEELPQVANGLFGRGVIGVSRRGHQRLVDLPSVMADDLAFSEVLASARCVVPEAEVVIRPPKTMRDLLRRRIRVYTGNAQADVAGIRGAGAKTSWSSLARLAAAKPRLIPRLPVFLGVAVAAKWHARKAISEGDFTTWLRDESSRG
jgi:glycosyltransferase involved in cell wall biosynthesis